MNIQKLWLCVQCEDVHEDSNHCPVCGEKAQMSLKDTKLGSLGTNRVKRSNPRTSAIPTAARQEAFLHALRAKRGTVEHIRTPGSR